MSKATCRILVKPKNIKRQIAATHCSNSDRSRFDRLNRKFPIKFSCSHDKICCRDMQLATCLLVCSGLSKSVTILAISFYFGNTLAKVIFSFVNRQWHQLWPGSSASLLAVRHTQLVGSLRSITRQVQRRGVYMSTGRSIWNLIVLITI